MQINFDYHTHTVYSHGKGTILENAIAAKEKGLNGLAITDHGFSHMAFGMKRRKLARMYDECKAAEKETGVKVLLGLEGNIQGDSGRGELIESDYDKIDIYLCGVHRAVKYPSARDLWKLLFSNMYYDIVKKDPPKKLIEYNTNAYVRAIKNNPIDILVHLNYQCFCDVKTVAQCCADYGTYLEINTKKIHLSEEEWQQVFDTNVNFVVDADAHSPDRVGDTALFEEQLKRINFPIDRIYNMGDKQPNFRFQEFKKRL